MAVNECLSLYVDFNTIEPTLRNQIIVRPEAKQLWTDIKTRFCQINEARIYQLQSDLLTCRQGPTESLVAYYGRMITIWNALLEHDALPPCSCSFCPCDWKLVITARREKEKVRIFLMGIDDRFASIRSQILGISPLPSLDLIYNRLLQDEGIRNLSSLKSDSTPDAMAFATRYSQACKRPGHSLKFCYLVTGKFPESWGDRPRDRIYIDPNATDLSNAIFVPDPRRKNSTDQTKQSVSGPSPKAHMASTSIASMPPDTSSSHPPLAQFDKLNLNNLTPRELEELGTLWQAHKSDQANERLNVSNLLMDSTLTIQFSHNLCLIQDRISKTVIGAGEQHEGLYYLTGVRQDKATACMADPPDSVELWH
ncbi:uncharacterized protein LOC141594622 [Silene latifolia]|uniref:uncharacterized protein LOC141594622 n=1 Tax=Silene latifolia TaxID=37657 RepID=UPI003D77C35C